MNEASFEHIVIGGAPGVGKSTLCSALKSQLGMPFIEFSSFRSPHLNPMWTDASPEEEEMAFENLSFAVENYLRHGYKNVILTDFTDERLEAVARRFGKARTAIFTLVMKDESALRTRIQARGAGFTDAEAALAWNRRVAERPSINRETKIVVDDRSVEDLANSVLEAL